MLYIFFAAKPFGKELSLTPYWTISITDKEVFLDSEEKPEKVSFETIVENLRPGEEVLFAFDHGYSNVIKVLFMRDLKIFLWSLLFIIPGIIKSYEYYMNAKLNIFKYQKETDYNIWGLDSDDSYRYFDKNNNTYSFSMEDKKVENGRKIHISILY